MTADIVLEDVTEKCVGIMAKLKLKQVALERSQIVV